MSLLVVEKLSKSFGTVDALRDIDLTLSDGEIVSLIGPSGCGKSSLLRIVAGLDPDYRGTLRVADKDVVGPMTDVGVVFQEPRLFPWLTVRQNIGFGQKNGMRNQIEHLAWQVGLGAFLDRLPKELSGGMAQRCAIARALISRPRLLLMDEPLSALDAFTRMHLQDLILDVWQEYGTSILMVTHDIDEALYLSDRIIVMTDRPGKVKAEIPITLERPRDRQSDVLVALERIIMNELDFAMNTQRQSKHVTEGSMNGLARTTTAN